MDNSLRQLLSDQRRENEKILKPLHIISFMTGVNVKYKSGFWDPIKILNASLITAALIGLYAQYYLAWYNRNGTFIDMADPICTANQVWVSILKLAYLLFVQHKCHDLLCMATKGSILYDLDIFDLNIQCKRLLLQDIRMYLQQSWQHIKHQLCFYIVSVTLACGFYMLSCLFANYYYMHVNPQNFTLQLPLPALFPVWHEHGVTWPYYHIQYAITGAGNFICGACAICFDGVFIVIVVHCSVLFQVLHRLLDFSTDVSVPRDQRFTYIMCCVRLHNSICSYYRSINQLYRSLSLAQCVLSTQILCVVLFMMNVGVEQDMTMFFKMIFFLFAAGFQIFLYCYNGQKISSQSELTATYWYSTRWYLESRQYRRIIAMMVQKTQRPLQLQVSGFTTMSYTTLLSILQTSSSYFLLLRNLNGMT